MATEQFDLAIIGGGPTGSALALLLAKLAPKPHKIALYQSEQRNRYGHATHADSRVIAINEGSRVLLRELGVWPTDVAPIHTIHVSQRTRLGRTLIDRSDFNADALGYVLRYSQLHEALLDAVAQTDVSLHTGTPAHPIDGDETVAIEQNTVIVAQAKLVVRADGMNQLPNQEQHTQVALLGQAWVSQPRMGWAYERFTRTGPLAVLPHPEGDGSQSIVWCCSPAESVRLMALDVDAFASELGQTFGHRLGTFSVKQPFKAYPLYKSLTSAPVQGRLVSIGNAAQTLHPVAGQGLNLGLRDAATLAHCLRDWIAQPHRDPKRSLSIYGDLRLNDRRITVTTTDWMSTIFTSGQPLVEHAAGLALLSLDLFAPLRSPLARHLMQGLRA